jgi:hypothetical protein
LKTRTSSGGEAKALPSPAEPTGPARTAPQLRLRPQRYFYRNAGAQAGGVMLTMKKWGMGKLQTRDPKAP